MSSPIPLSPDRTCYICKKRFLIGEHIGHLRALDLDIPDYKAEIYIRMLCPDCIRELSAIIIKDIKKDTLSKIEKPILIEKSILKGLDFSGVDRKTSLPPKPTISREIPQVEIPSIINWVFWILVVVSVSVFTYSLISKLFPQLNLRVFPFYPYIIGYSLLILLVQFKKILPLYLIIVLLNFGSPTFRGIFFSHFSSTAWTIVFTVMFIASNVVSLLVINSGLIQRFVSSKSNGFDIAKGALFSLVLTLFLYFGLISPFYLGAIKPGPYRGHIEPEPYKIDHVYEEVLTATNADREIGRRYLLDGKESANKGSRSGYEQSLWFYKEAITLIDNFSTAYAEMAYSYASIGKILKATKAKDKAIGEYFDKARKAITKAKELNPNNPTVYGVEALMEYYMGNEKSAKNSLIKAENLAKKGGYSDRVVQAKAMLEKKKVKRVEYLLGIKNIIPNNAELHSLLGIAYYQIGNKEKAKQMIERAILLNPDYGEAYLNLALVSDEEDIIYKKVSQKDADFKEKAKYFSKLHSVQWYLKTAYFVSIIGNIFVFIVVLLSQLLNFDPNTKTIPQSEALRRMKRILKASKTVMVITILFFICSYGIFEFYIHIYRPINTISHMFPVKFPFF